MAINETAKPCPSTERKKPKVVFLKQVLDRVGTFVQVCNLIDRHWDWIKAHWQVLRDWFGDFL
jgi:phage antirepressor YoqD-like protein